MGFWSRIFRRRGRKGAKPAVSTYSAAQRERSTRDWNPRSTSADGAIIPDLPTLNARARQLVRDDPHAKGIVRAFKRHVVGTGIIPAAMVRDDAGNPNAQFNRRADELFFDWSRKPRRCDIERRRTFADIQRWAVGELVEVGEALVIESVRVDPLTGRGDLVLQLVESEQLDRYKLRHTGEDGIEREVRGGVEVDEFGAPVAYWIYERHPHDGYGIARPTPITLESRRIPAYRVHHIMDPERARQTRGVTRLAPCMRKLRDLSEFDFANLQSARAEASIGLIVVRQQEVGSIGLNQSGEGGTGEQGVDADGNTELAMSPIMFAKVGEGEDVRPFTPARPGNTYEPFMRANLRAIASSAGVSYEQVERDFTGGSYSSQRQGMLEDQREFEPLQTLIINHLCQPVWESFIGLAVMNGDLIAPGFSRERDRWTYAEWYPPAWPWIDPQKDAAADQLAIEQGFDTLDSVCRRRGLDWREVLEQRAEERRYQQELERRVGPPSQSPGAAEPASPTPVDIEPVGPTSVEDAPDALQSTQGLNGAQVAAAVEILEKLGTGLMSPEAANSLLRAIGIDREQVDEMVRSTMRDRESIRQRMEDVDVQPEPRIQPAEVSP